MPPRTRGTKGTKILKENLVAVNKTKSKAVGKATKPPRKALADKTNSASDDNTSLENKKQVQKHAVSTGIENIARPRRERRLPTRYVENTVLNNLSSCKIQSENAHDESKTTNHQTPVNVNTTVESPFKTPQKSLELSLVANKPKRICRLPSKFDDHSISPSKFIPVQPCHASTPILQSKNSKVPKKAKNIEKTVSTATVNNVIPKRKAAQKRPIVESPETSADSNNNAKRRLIRHKATESELSSQDEKVSPKKAKKLSKKVAENSFSFRILEDKKKSSQNEVNNLDVYEFTYDPNEEPPPTKKKRKKAVKKKPTKPKTVVFKNNYDQNVAKALEALKNVVAKKPDLPKVVKSAEPPTSTKITQNETNNNAVQNVPQNNTQGSKQIVQEVAQQKLLPNNPQVSQESAHNVPKIIIEPAPEPTNVMNVIEEQKFNSVRVEDIAADFEIDDYNDINYSPVNSPQRPKTPSAENHTLERSVHNNDPLNLRGDLSFFDDNPVASSSMNMSVKHPQASPWRVEFSNLPIKWHANTYVKPNMTPAVESSFINSENNKKKHVYTNIIGHDDTAPEVVPNQSNLKQTSIISFIREVVERSAQKKKRGRSVTPTKANNLFDDVPSGALNGNTAPDKTPKKTRRNDNKSNKKTNENVSNASEDPTQDKENTNDKENKKKKVKPAKDKDGTFFGFDDSEDQENVSPMKVDNSKARALRPRSRAVLQEINAMSGPMRVLPLAAKSKIATSSDAVNKVYEELKSAADAPVFPEKSSMPKSTEVTNINEVTCDIDMNEDPHSVHLFEDIELVHHLKPTRKSYSKAKKVTFRQHSTSSESQELDPEQEQVSSEEDDLADLTFTMPSFKPQKKAKKKKMTKKQIMSKKEQQALEEWAAGFNSMCEDIEDVPLIVE